MILLRTSPSADLPADPLAHPVGKVRCHHCGYSNTEFERSETRPDGAEVATYLCLRDKCGRRTAIVKTKEAA